MPISRRDFLKFSGGAVAAISATAAVGSRTLWAQPTAQDSAMVDDVYHLLNRITWGVRADELAHAREIGYQAYLEEQLVPDRIDDSVADALLAENPILTFNRADAGRLQNREWRTQSALIDGMLTRAVHSQRQLFERMSEFWFDHFNIPADELGADLVVYHRDVVRRNVLGNFRDLLFGTARTPAMLYYLDNYLNVAEHPNENWAREVLELHTLGVDGGYTENDVKEIARAFTGWTINDGTDDGFWFDASVHDTDEKVIFGHTFPAGRGIEDGLHVLSLLANHPMTARYVSGKLIRRFVSDMPPESLVESTTQVWIDNNGEIVPVLRHVFNSDEFRASVGQKLRRPLEFFVAALRSTGTQFTDSWRRFETLEDLAQIPYGWQPPNGYPDVADAWMNTGGLLARWNVAVLLTHGAHSDINEWGVRSALYEQISDPATVGELVDQLAVRVYGDTILSPATRAHFVDFASDSQGEATTITAHLMARKYATLYGLMLSAPIFQWR